MKTLKKDIKSFVKTQLGTSKCWAQNALLKIYEFQTAEEQSHEHTEDMNGVGFTGTDGEILTSFAKQLMVKKYLSDKQMGIVFKKMPKYWMQIIMVSDPIKLELLVNRLN
jgi:hypothetical protein